MNRDKAIELRRGETGLFFYDMLKEKLIKLNKKIASASPRDDNDGIVNNEKANEIIKKLENVKKFNRGKSGNPAIPQRREISLF